jgi:hypothetical protein
MGIRKRTLCFSAFMTPMEDQCAEAQGSTEFSLNV